MSINDKIGKFLQLKREQNGLSLQDVQDAIGKSRYTISGYEHGRNNITAEMLMVLCNLYKTTLNDCYEYVWSQE